MPRKAKYATEEERQAARREQKRRSMAESRAKAAKEEGREVTSRRRFKTEEERKTALIEKRREEKTEKRKKRASTRKVWTPSFVGVDGESFETGELLPDGSRKQAYYLLLRSDKEPLYTGNPLSTWECLNYLTKDYPKDSAVVGYFLNFDFEWILKDVYQKEYKALQEGSELSLEADEFRVQWFKGKRLVVKRVRPSARRLPPEARDPRKHFTKHTFQDTAGFFQSSFVSALRKWGVGTKEELEIIIDGKRTRGGFQLEDFDRINTYNAMEMKLLSELMLKVYESFKMAYTAAGLEFKVNSDSWSGPGGFASDFLTQTLWTDEHQPPKAEQAAHFSEINKDFFGNEAALLYPFSLAYFGGRIELAAVGKFRPYGGGTAVYNYDINSAYPYALSLLPRWTEDDFALYENVGNVRDEYCKELLDRRLMGMYGVRFNFPDDWTWYPFPVRQTRGKSANVYYPRKGTTNIMSPELFAVLDTLTEEELRYLTITYAYVLDNSDGYGDALNRMEKDRLCTTAIKTDEMATVRLQCKTASKNLEDGKSLDIERDKFLATAEKALKLILNSLYGKTVQQIGAHKHYNDFASAWITSVCRALLWRALAPERKSHNVLMTMTDGIYSQVPLPFAADRLSKVLGEWEEEKFTYFETFQPGIYRYEKKGKMEYKVRGFLAPEESDKQALFDRIWESVSRGTNGEFPYKQFMPRNLALMGWAKEAYLRQFYTGVKIIKSDLSAKREKDDVTGWLIPGGKEFHFFRPKLGYDNISKGYALDFEGEKFKLTEEEAQVEAQDAYIDSILDLKEEYYDYCA